MGRDQGIGATLAILGIAGSAAVSAYLTMNPHAAGVVLNGAVIVCIISFVLGILILVWPKDKLSRGIAKGIGMAKLTLVSITGGKIGDVSVKNVDAHGFD